MSIKLFPKKITTATMGLRTPDLEEICSGETKAVPVLRVWGICSSTVDGTSQFGTYTKFGGEFGAINLITGDEARSQQLLLPAIAEGIVKSLYDKAAKAGGVAQIGVEIAVEENLSAKGGTKFRYVVIPLYEYKGDDALSEMAKTLPPLVLVKALKDKRKK